MEKEVDPAVLAVINEKRLLGDMRSPVEIIAKMGVFDARQKAADSAWLATGDQVIATIWAELVIVSATGHWFCLESLDTQYRIGRGGERTAAQMQRAKDRTALLKRTFDSGQALRAVLQINRIAIADLETDKAAKVSVRVRDDQEWRVATWIPDHQMAVLVRGPSAWLPSEQDMQAARARGGVPAIRPTDSSTHASREEVQAAAMAFSSYGYKTEHVAGQSLGYDLEVSDKKGVVLLQLAVKGTVAGRGGFQLTAQEYACARRGDPWRLAVVTDAGGATARHTLYKPSEVDNAPGLEALPDQPGRGGKP
jgi:hypothetical protein